MIVEAFQSLLPWHTITGQYQNLLKVFREIRCFFNKPSTFYRCSFYLAFYSSYLSYYYSQFSFFSVPKLYSAFCSALIQMVASQRSISSFGGQFKSTPFLDIQALRSENLEFQRVRPMPKTSPYTRIQLQLQMFSPQAWIQPELVTPTPELPMFSSPLFNCAKLLTGTKPISMAPCTESTSTQKQAVVFCLLWKQTADLSVPLNSTCQILPLIGFCSSIVILSGAMTLSILVWLRQQSQLNPKTGLCAKFSGVSLQSCLVLQRWQSLQMMKATIATTTRMMARLIRKAVLMPRILDSLFLGWEEEELTW